MFKNKGFSLVELVVVIAIMAVMTAVLAPALLQYTEKSRAEKDYSSMDEVVNAVQLAMSDQDCYDEVVHYNTKGQVSCYIDTNRESNYDKVITKEAIGNNAEQYTFDDDARLLDETPYFAAGSMRGVTITFSPDAASADFCYNLKDGVVNQFNGEQATLGELETLYNRVRQSVGDTIKLDSQTYRNSDFTIFIKIGSTGGNQSSAQDAIQTYGQFSGTNLVADENILYSKANSTNNPSTSVLGVGNIEFEDGMTWDEWVNSPYNTHGYYSTGGRIFAPNDKMIKDVIYSDIINKDTDYSLASRPSPAPI